MTGFTMKTIASLQPQNVQVAVLHPRHVQVAAVLIACLAACGGKPAQTAENADQSGDGGGPAADETASKAAPGATGSAAAAPGDDSAKKKTPCGGSDIADLASVLSQAECEVGAPKEGAQPKDLKDALDVKVQADSPKIAPGTSATITVVFKNKKAKADLALDFIVDPEPRFDSELYTVKEPAPTPRRATRRRSPPRSRTRPPSTRRLRA